jgi:ketosteroid isomerase-like protein
VSEENVDVVRRLMGLVSEANAGVTPPELFELFAPDVRIDMSRRVLNPDVYEGHEGVRRLVREVRQVWDDFRIDPERLVDAGDRVVVVELRRGRGKGSGVEVEQRSCVIWTLRDGQVIAAETDLDLEEALATVS